MPRPDVWTASAMKPKRWMTRTLGRTFWTQRFYTFASGRMHWANRPLADNVLVLKMHPGIDLAATPMELEATETAGRQILILRPAPNQVWSTGDNHERAGSSLPIVLDVTESGFDSTVWVKRVTKHIAFAHSRKTQAHNAAAAMQPLSCGGVCKEPCPICLVDLVDVDEDDEAVETQCGHCFHRNCLTRWLVQDEACPVCRSVLLDEARRLTRRSATVASQTAHVSSTQSSSTQSYTMRW